MVQFDGGSVQALAVRQPGLSFENHTITRRKPGERDVAIEVDACGQVLSPLTSPRDIISSISTA
jgi:hypothetical protein